ncbi:Bug family tripartite tricarboxylate transporter substrate binding protein [Rhodoferax sediminis]|uniref:Tripartite tricarboxylate transporter substrate binding protein n=1 Tax=Rhodoferax sediminis TaxID=2509614 RepID=A0A515DDL1_9BURK|nr:tripartite tricarboxylate transporter substrate binding protein [Rhodoferax sediminis]QDL38494.1 tripartite tricarboxylate transporter substrate binding protein [Rhodoferax sediminis]
MHRRTLLIAGAFALSISSAAFAQDTYPNKPIKLIVGYAPGGSADIAARLAAQKLTLELKQPVIVENRPGAGGNIGSEVVAHARPDGYTLLMAATAQIVINPSLYKKMTFDPAKDLAPITLMQNEYNLMVVTPSVPAKTLKEFIAYAKANPTAVTFASPGIGTPAHLAGELMNQLAGLKMLHVPYKGTAPAVSDLVAGHVTMAIDNMPALLPQVKAGALRALAVASEHRAPAAPDVPTAQEAGLPGFVVPAWKGMMAPAGTPRPIIDKLHAAMVKILAMPDVRKQMINLGAEPAGGTPEQFAEMIKAQTVKWAALVKSTGTTLD